MVYNKKDIQHVRKAAKKSPSEHLKTLVEMVLQNKSYSDLFEYGMKFLPHLEQEKGSGTDLNQLANYNPVIVKYFDILSDMPSLPDVLKDIATDFAIFANGEALQMDKDYLQFDPASKLINALSLISKR